MRVWITVVAGLVALAASAQEQRQCVNPDIVNGLVFRGRSDLKVTLVRGLPAYMTGIRAPAGFNPIGERRDARRGEQSCLQDFADG